MVQTYDVAIGDGAVQTVTITITGDNDAAQITSGVQSGDAEEDERRLRRQRHDSFTDVDLIDSHSVSVTPGAGGYLGSFTTSLSDSTGRAATRWAGASGGQQRDRVPGRRPTVIQTYDVAIGDGAVQTVTMTITGDNDAAQITSGVQSGDAEEDSGDYGASGTISFTDVDLIDSHSVSVTPGAVGYLGSFTTSLSDSTGTGSGSLGWSFSVANSALQYLGEGQTVVQTYDVAIGDGAVQTVTITITGDNDAVQIDQRRAERRRRGRQRRLRRQRHDGLHRRGPDRQPQRERDAGSGRLPGQLHDQPERQHRHGQRLAGLELLGGQQRAAVPGRRPTVVQTYDVAIGDGAVQTVTITITGDNDAVQITSGVQSGDAEEDSGDYGASGTISFTDVDLIDSHSVSVTPGAGGYLGSFTTSRATAPARAAARWAGASRWPTARCSTWAKAKPWSRPTTWPSATARCRR